MEAKGRGGEPGSNPHIDLYLQQIPRKRKPRAVSTVHTGTVLRGQTLIVAISAPEALGKSSVILHNQSFGNEVLRSLRSRGIRLNSRSKSLLPSFFSDYNLKRLKENSLRIFQPRFGSIRQRNNNSAV